MNKKIIKLTLFIILSSLKLSFFAHAHASVALPPTAVCAVWPWGTAACAVVATAAVVSSWQILNSRSD